MEKQRIVWCGETLLLPSLLAERETVEVEEGPFVGDQVPSIG